MNIRFDTTCRIRLESLEADQIKQGFSCNQEFFVCGEKIISVLINQGVESSVSFNGIQKHLNIQLSPSDIDKLYSSQFRKSGIDVQDFNIQIDILKS